MDVFVCYANEALIALHCITRNLAGAYARTPRLYGTVF